MEQEPATRPLGSGGSTEIVELVIPVTHQELAACFERVHHYRPEDGSIRVSGVIDSDELERIVGTGRDGFHLTRLPHLRAAKANGGE